MSDDTMIPDAPAPQADLDAAAERDKRYQAFMDAKAGIEAMQAREAKLDNDTRRLQELIDDYEVFTALRDSKGYKRLQALMDVYMEQSGRHDPISDPTFATWATWHKGQQAFYERMKFNIEAKAGGDDGPTQFGAWKDQLRMVKHALVEVRKAKAEAMQTFMQLQATDGGGVQ